MILPEKVRKAIEKTIKQIKVSKNIYGVGLFGSWSRGDASPVSDVDLLLVDASGVNYEHIERVEVGGFFVDLDHVPLEWIKSVIPPEIDQKLYEMQILYDKDWSLTNSKLLMSKTYSSPERVAIRTEGHLIDSDIYLSRATSAFSRADFRSASLFNSIALEHILKVLLEITLQPFSNSRFIDTLKFSAGKVKRQELFEDYIKVTGLDKVESAQVMEKLSIFKMVWNNIDETVKKNMQTLESSHYKVKAKMKYYLNSSFFRGTVQRTTSLVDSEKPSEALHYLRSMLFDFIENYVWLKFDINKVKGNYVTSIQCLEHLEKRNVRNYYNILRIFDLDNIGKTSVDGAIQKTREITLKIRKDRKVLIKNNLLKS